MRPLCMLRVAVAPALLAVLASGCGDDLYQMATVTGRVTCDGKPAWGGVVTLEPLDAPHKTGRPKGNPGRPSRGTVGEDGRFTVTYEPGGGRNAADGALIGPHRVVFILPQSTPWKWSSQDDWLPEEEKAKLKAELAQRPVYPELACSATIAPAEVEVKPGQNEFEFTLQAQAPSKRRIEQPSGSD